VEQLGGKRFIILLGFCLFTVSYYLVITAFLPSTIVSDPRLLNEGAYVTYLTEDLGFNDEVLRNGTYAWRIVSISTDSNGRTVARVNETFTGTSEWRALNRTILYLSSRASFWFCGKAMDFQSFFSFISL